MTDHGTSVIQLTYRQQSVWCIPCLPVISSCDILQRIIKRGNWQKKRKKIKIQKKTKSENSAGEVWIQCKRIYRRNRWPQDCWRHPHVRARCSQSEGEPDLNKEGVTAKRTKTAQGKGADEKFHIVRTLWRISWHWKSKNKLLAVAPNVQEGGAFQQRHGREAPGTWWGTHHKEGCSNHAPQALNKEHSTSVLSVSNATGD